MIQISFTDSELAAVIFAVNADLEILQGDPEHSKEDAFVIKGALHKLRKAERLTEDGED